MAERQLPGLNSDDANALIRNLEEAQRALREEQFQAFELLAGSIASYEMAKVSARDAFLAMPFAHVWRIERAGTGSRLWQPYRLFYTPNGPGGLYSDIEVVIGTYGNIERVVMIYKPPPDF